MAQLWPPLSSEMVNGSAPEPGSKSTNAAPDFCELPLWTRPVMPVARPRLTWPGMPSGFAKTVLSRLFSASKLLPPISNLSLYQDFPEAEESSSCLMRAATLLASERKAASSKMDSLGIAVKRIAPRRASTTASSSMVKPAAPGGEPWIRKHRIRKSPAWTQGTGKGLCTLYISPGPPSSDIYHAPEKEPPKNVVNPVIEPRSCLKSRFVIRLTGCARGNQKVR